MATPTVAPNQDDEHLRLLSIFHYVVAALAAMFALLPIFHLVLGLVMMTGGLASGEAKGFPAAIAGAFFVAFSLFLMTLGFGLAACLAAAGRFLAERRRYIFCLVVAGISCAFSPFGTVLGIFTLVVLLRESVRARFGGTPAAVAGASESAAPTV